MNPAATAFRLLNFRITRLSFLYIVIATLMPVCLIIVTLTWLNLERAVFSIMGGIRERTSNDGAYAILNLLSVLPVLLAGPLLLFYGTAIFKRWKKRSDPKSKI
jgi:hypothetical protein